MFGTKTKSAWLLAALAWVAAALPSAALAQARSLQDMEFATLDGDRVLMTLTLSGPAPEPAVFTIDHPARLSLDLPDTSLAVAERFRKVNIGAVRAAAAAEAKGRTRVVVELSSLVPYLVRVDGNKILVRLDAGATRDTPVAPTVGGKLAPEITGRRSSLISAIDFRRGEKGEGRVVVTMDDPKTPVDVSERGGMIVARFKNASIPDNFLRRMDVLDFATPVKYVDAKRDGANVEISLTPVGKVEFEQVAYQTGNIFSLELHPVSQEEVDRRRKDNPQFAGERITLSFQSVDVRSLLQIIADVAGTNMVVSDSVTGEVAMRLQNVPWDQALDIILRTKGLGVRQQGNVMLVAPLAELASREKVEMESERQKVELAPLRTEIIQVNYAKASDLAKLLKTNNSSILSSRGQITVDERTNTMIILETREKLSEVRELLGRLDLPVRQVLIESRIVIARDDYRKELGSRFGVSAIGDNNRNGLFTTQGTLEATDGTVTSFRNGDDVLGVGSLNQRLNVNLPSAGNSLAFAILGSNYLVDLELSALQTEGRGEVVSTPRVITANGREALVEQGREIPYLEAASSGAATVSFRKAVLSLQVTPQITPDGRILMDLKVTADTQGEDVSIGLGSAPSIDTRRLSTQVLVQTGDTVVLGGVFEHVTDRAQSKVPLLGDIPFFGRLFRNDANEESKRELLIFITPKLVQEGLQVN